MCLEWIDVSDLAKRDVVVGIAWDEYPECYNKVGTSKGVSLRTFLVY